MISVLAVFWYRNNRFYGSEATMRDKRAVAYGDYLQLNDDHFAIWDKYAPQMGVNPRALEYDLVPRGRILFHIPTHHFIVVASKLIVNNKDIQEKLLSWYGLPGNTEFRGDEHYR